jgi:hypothetical protein
MKVSSSACLQAYGPSTEGAFLSQILETLGSWRPGALLCGAPFYRLH